MASGIKDYPAQGKIDAARVPIVTRYVQATGFTVEMSDPQAFVGRVLFGEARGEEPACGRGLVQLRREFGTLISHALGLTKDSSADDMKRVGSGT